MQSWPCAVRNHQSQNRLPKRNLTFAAFARSQSQILFPVRNVNVVVLYGLRYAESGNGR